MDLRLILPSVGLFFACLRLSSEPDFLPVAIRNVSLSNLGFVVLLGCQMDPRLLPVFIGESEASSISAALYGNRREEFLHDFFQRVAVLNKATLSSVRISEVRDGTFYAVVSLQQGKEFFDLDARPSDALALALRFEAPIFVSRKVFEESAVTVQETEASSNSPASAILEQKLQEAILEERYEDAAEIRDFIQKQKDEPK